MIKQFNADLDTLAAELDSTHRRRVGRRSAGLAPLVFLLAFLPALAGPPIAKGQISWTGTVLEIDCGSSAAAERRCVEALANPQMAAGRSFVCDARARAAGRCPGTITGDQNFLRTRPQDCTDQDIPGTRGRCLYGRGADRDTFASLPTCDAGEWGHVALVEDEDIDYWCNGSAFVAATAQTPGQWRPPAIQCGDGPTADCVGAGDPWACCTGAASGTCDTRDVWPDGGALLSVTTAAGLPPCNADTNNLRAWVGATNSARPHVDGTLYRCQDPTWATTALAYRDEITDAAVNATCRNWMNAGEYWVPGVFAACSGDNWLCLVGKDLMERYFEGVFFGSRSTGRAALNDQRAPTVEE